MGVDYFNCSVCGDIFPDVIDYGYCTNCESVLCKDCYTEAVERYGSGNPPKDKEGWYEGNNPDGCPSCDPEIVSDDAVLEYLLAESGKTVDELKVIILQKRRLK